MTHMNIRAEEGSDRIRFQGVDDENAWRAYLNQAGIANLYNSWEWGEYKSRTGWSVSRLLVKGRSASQPIGALQLQTRKLGPARIHLLQGGVCLADPGEDVCAEILQALQDKYLRLGWADFLLVNYYESASDIYTRSMLKLGYLPHLGNKMYSFYVRFDGSGQDVERQLTRNWRHNLKRATKNSELSVRWCESEAEREAAFLALSEMYEKLRERKSFAGAVDTAKIKDVVVRDSNFLIVVAEVEGKPVAIRIGYRSSNCVRDFLAASNGMAVKNYANYLLLWTLIKKAESLGLHGFECGGIDPLENAGVYNFKRGLGAELSVNGPLWLFHRNGSVRKLTMALRAFF